MAEVAFAPGTPPAAVAETVGGTGGRRFLPPRNLATDADADAEVRLPEGASPGIVPRPATIGATIQIVPFLAQLLAQEQIDLEGTGADEADPVIRRDGLKAYRIAKGVGLDPEEDAPDDDTIVHRVPTSFNLTI